MSTSVVSAVAAMLAGCSGSTSPELEVPEARQDPDDTQHGAVEVSTWESSLTGLVSHGEDTVDWLVFAPFETVPGDLEVSIVFHGAPDAIGVEIIDGDGRALATPSPARALGGIRWRIDAALTK